MLIVHAQSNVNPKLSLCHFVTCITPRRCTYVLALFAESITPGANRYCIEENQTRKGKGKSPSFSMKGRPSPFVYSGFSNVAMSRCSSLV